MTQTPLFDVLPKGKPEPQIVAEKKRCASNYDKVLARLRRGPATNIELTEICLRYGARIWEMKQNGLSIDTRRGSGPGVFIYILQEHP